jgi:ArsR family transcriptional regulator
VQALKRQPLCVTEIVSRLGISQEATSQHLRVLKDVGIVKWQKHGPFVYYHLNKESIVRLRKAIDGFFKAGD